jgi:mono/diheme cytochrome c family protein
LIGAAKLGADFVKSKRPTIARFAAGLGMLAIALGTSGAAQEVKDKLPAESLAAWDKIVAVLQHPRCLNCHQKETPLQGDSRRVHIPPVKRGAGPAGGRGVGTMKCANCHNSIGNNEMAGVPGAPEWQLAPESMNWQGVSSRELCEQLRDEKKNGGFSPEKLIEHTHHALVVWGWKPGAGRKPIPIEHDAFVGLMTVWVAHGRECPGGEKPQ